MSIATHEVRIDFNESHARIQRSNDKSTKIHANIIEIIVQNEFRKKRICQINTLSDHYYYSSINIILKRIDEI